MSDRILINDLYLENPKKMIKANVLPLRCYICKKELNGHSITARTLDGKTVFLCSYHYNAEPYQFVSVD